PRLAFPAVYLLQHESSDARACPVRAGCHARDAGDRLGTARESVRNALNERMADHRAAIDRENADVVRQDLRPAAPDLHPPSVERAAERGHLHEGAVGMLPVGQLIECQELHLRNDPRVVSPRRRSYSQLTAHGPGTRCREGSSWLWTQTGKELMRLRHRGAPPVGVELLVPPDVPGCLDATCRVRAIFGR